MLLICSAGWIALSGRFSMAYDENTHLGIIQLYSDRLLPFWSETPAGSEAMGAVARDPSYLYHYLLSFPYRLIDSITQSAAAQIILLRFINIGIFCLGLIAYYRILLRTRASKAVVHAVLMVFVLLPAVPFLAAQINYDNLLFLVSGICILLTMQVTAQLKREGTVSVVRLGGLLGLCLLGSLVKYAFLPVFAGIVLWLAYAIWKHIRSRGFAALPQSLRAAWASQQLLVRIGLIVLVVAGAGLFVERYGVNVARYHTPTPECNQVLSTAACQAYTPWRRNYELHQQKLAGTSVDPGPNDPLTYTAQHWLKAMSHQMVFALNGRTDYFKVGDPFILPKLLVVIVGGIGLVLAAFWYRVLRKWHAVDGLAIVAIVYVGALWLQGYMDYVHLGQAVAIQGRYLMPVLPLVCLIAGLAFAKLLRLPHLKPAFATLCIAILLFQGGGAMAFILRSDEHWYWENSAVVRVNKAAQKLFRPLVVDR